ncbi:P-loop containing nucleoside triphosphate hydrolase protein [Rhizodiscina lignyota]|uniref:P-loop containing nucleoside triphosphate hydrolase protein n=1 Tax=Rhizodiscina lignyota TaxID=1504668 RepID=A0A9P4MAM6_9PEZI|nr:P-loop containing nucleoside triphosphate hydrolase protein [Rhizodiscina lignyota]
MTCVLKHYQLLGAAFMRRRERGDDQPPGGLCADQMGLGKTIMMLANIVNGRVPPKSKEPRTTLIVATPALINQWGEEIARHCNMKGFEVIKYCAGHKINSTNITTILETFDIVLTTYYEVMRSWPKVEYPAHIMTAEAKAEYKREYIMENKGPLHQIHFQRIVLDEAQAIKNRQSRTFLACKGLMAKHRWVISGTPLQNSVEEIYPYFKFLRVPHSGSYRVFKQNFLGDDDPDKQARLQQFLSKVLLRRTHTDRLFGRPLVKLPAASNKIHWIKFNDLERNVYEIVRRRMIQRINTYSKNDELEKKYHNVLVMLLRLRQLTGHIISIEEVLRDLLEFEDHERLKELAEEYVNPNTAKDHREQIEHLRHSCAICDQPPVTPWITSCFHIMCADCLEILQTSAAERDMSHARCPDCGDMFYMASPLTDWSFDLPDGEEEDGPKKKKKRGKKDDGGEKGVPSWLNMPNQYLLPSSKTVAIKAQILNWLEEDPGTKVIVYSQFLSMIRILSRVCMQEKWGYQEYHGEMTITEREAAIKNFKEEDGTKVLIASLRAGGVGLNLTMASKVIVVDPWWNLAVEEQAFARVFRIGQKSETAMTRFVVENTVDEAMTNMQRRKKNDIDEVMEDGSGGRRK